MIWDFMAAFPFLQIGCLVMYNDTMQPRSHGGAGEVAPPTWAVDARDLENARPFLFVMFCSMLRILKGMRLWKIAEVMEELSMRSPGWATVFTLVRLLFYLFFCAHYLGCIWFYIGIGSGSIKNGWIAGEGGILPRDESNFLYEWICCMCKSSPA
jgi:hypothetical protein